MIAKYKGSVNKDLEIIFDKIVERFPSGRMTAYILNNSTPDINLVMNNLSTFDYDSDHLYRDEQSKKDALELYEMLQSYIKI